MIRYSQWKLESNIEQWYPIKELPFNSTLVKKHVNQPYCYVLIHDKPEKIIFEVNQFESRTIWVYVNSMLLYRIDTGNINNNIWFADNYQLDEK